MRRFSNPLIFWAPPVWPSIQAERIIGEIMVRYSRDEKKRFEIKRKIKEKDEAMIEIDQKFDKKALAMLQIQ